MAAHTRRPDLAPQRGSHSHGTSQLGPTSRSGPPHPSAHSRGAAPLPPHRRARACLRAAPGYTQSNLEAGPERGTVRAGGGARAGTRLAVSLYLLRRRPTADAAPGRNGRTSETWPPHVPTQRPGGAGPPWPPREGRSARNTGGRTRATKKFHRCGKTRRGCASATLARPMWAQLGGPAQRCQHAERSCPPPRAW